MAKNPCPIALPPLHATEFLDYILLHHHPPTTLIICSTREAFLQELKTCIIHSTASLDSAEDSTPPTHHLLNPVIHLIATSRTIDIAFTPSVPHLRAYLATYPLKARPSSRFAGSDVRLQSQQAILAIWGLVALHRDTTEYSAQGLSRTMAGGVEAAELAGQRLVVAESKVLSSEVDAEGGRVASGPWKEQVPLLSGGMRFEGEGSGVGGRMLEVGVVVRKRCRFVRMRELRKDD